MQALAHQYKFDAKPIFNTEFGWAAPNTFNNSDDQSGYLMRSMLVGWGAGLGRFMWYAWDNSNWVTVQMTLADFKTPTPVAKAYVTLEGWTQGKEVSRCAAGTPATVPGLGDITDMSGDHSRIYWSYLSYDAGHPQPHLEAGSCRRYVRQCHGLHRGRAHHLRTPAAHHRVGGAYSALQLNTWIKGSRSRTFGAQGASLIRHKYLYPEHFVISINETDQHSIQQVAPPYPRATGNGCEHPRPEMCHAA